jgi:hypothetical protein
MLFLRFTVLIFAQCTKSQYPREKQDRQSSHVVVFLDAAFFQRGAFGLSESGHSQAQRHDNHSSGVIANNHGRMPRRQIVCCLRKARTWILGEVVEMLWTIFVILLVLWLVGLVSSYTLGGFIHLLLVAAVVVLILQLISGRRPVV